MFTEHLLDTAANNIMKNSETKSVILAPFNSTRRSIMNENGEIIRQTISDSILEIMCSKNVIKFGPKVREIDRQYEINNNADLDNGVYHKVEAKEDIKVGEELETGEMDDEEAEILAQLKQNNQVKGAHMQQLEQMIQNEE